MNKEFISELENIFAVLRSILFDNPRLIKNIDSSYEKVLLGQLQWIPSEGAKYLLKFYKYFLLIYKHFNLPEFVVDLKKENISASPEINLFVFISKSVKESEGMDSKLKAQIMNFVVKCKPLIECCSEIINNPMKYLERLLEREMNNVL
jgi:hypothetical protein